MDKRKVETIEEDNDSVTSLYKGQVAEYKDPRWFTISPDGKHYSDILVLIKEWIIKMHKWLYPSCRHYIFVLELDDSRPHFHGVCDVKDDISFTSKYWTIKNGNNSRVHTEFTKGGLSYIFKDVDITYKRTGVQPVYEYGDWLLELARRKEARRLLILERREQELKDNEIATPSWMLNNT